MLLESLGAWTGPVIKIGLFPLWPEDGTRSSFRNALFPGCYSFKRYTEFLNSTNFESYTPSLEPFRFYLLLLYLSRDSLESDELTLGYFLPDSLLCGLVVWIPGYRSRGRGLDSRRYWILWGIAGLEWDPLSLRRITEELLEWKVAAQIYKTEINGREDPLCSPLDNLRRAKVGNNFAEKRNPSVGIVHLRTKCHYVCFYFI
jgi:hypothetical protein